MSRGRCHAPGVHPWAQATTKLLAELVGPDKILFVVSGRGLRTSRSGGSRRGGKVCRWKFFCPAGEDRPAARMFRPRTDESPTAKLNFGPKLSAFAIDAGEVLPPGNRIPSS